MHGIPEGSVDIQPMHAFPIESNLDAMGGRTFSFHFIRERTDSAICAVDFRKGCYVGQELTVRTYHTGAVRKRILPVHITSPTSLPPYMSIKPSNSPISTTESTTTRTPRLRGTSTLLSTIAAPSIGSTLGLALVRLEHLREGVTLVAEANEKELWKVGPWWSDWWPEQPSTDLNSPLE